MVVLYPCIDHVVVQLQKLNLETKVVSTLVDETLFANGLVLDNEGQLLVCEQGKEGSPGHITRIHPVTGHSTIVADNWFNIPFNSPNDAVVKSDGSIWFTDPDYARWGGRACAHASVSMHWIVLLRPTLTVDMVCWCELT